MKVGTLGGPKEVALLDISAVDDHPEMGHGLPTVRDDIMTSIDLQDLIQNTAGPSDWRVPATAFGRLTFEHTALTTHHFR